MRASKQPRERQGAGPFAAAWRWLRRVGERLRLRPQTCRIFVNVDSSPRAGLYHAQWWVVGSDGVQHTGIRRATTQEAARAIAAIAADRLAEQLGFPSPDRIERGTPRQEVDHG